uniref:Uncharacterized protein n=1 Tax=Rhizophora mucronata TaxID=61149 RepID=A0A2P2PPT4_RHIMU
MELWPFPSKAQVSDYFITNIIMCIHFLLPLHGLISSFITLARATALWLTLEKK